MPRIMGHSNDSFGFNGRVYGPLGFTAEDGAGVCFSLYELEQHLREAVVYRPTQTGGIMRRKLRRYLIQRDGSVCRYCKRKLKYREVTIDHYFPPEMWRKDQVDLCDSVGNLVVACLRCNFVKGKKSPIGLVIYDHYDMRLKTRILRRLKWYTTNIKLILNGTRTLGGKHRGIEMYRNMTNAERKAARLARFQDI